MIKQRESVFRCVYSSPSSERIGHIRAWDAEEAVQLFRLELHSDGVDEGGTIRVVSGGVEPQGDGAGAR